MGSPDVLEAYTLTILLEEYVIFPTGSNIMVCCCGGRMGIIFGGGGAEIGLVWIGGRYAVSALGILTPWGKHACTLTTGSEFVE